MTTLSWLHLSDSHQALRPLTVNEVDPSPPGGVMRRRPRSYFEFDLTKRRFRA